MHTETQTMTRALGKTGILTAREAWEHEQGDRKGSQKEMNQNIDRLQTEDIIHDQGILLQDNKEPHSKKKTFQSKSQIT